MLPKVSIIVPVYQAETTIAKCLDSLLNQTYKNLEIILINDGSTDKSESIIKQYKDQRIVYLKTKNSGIGTSRNRGLAISQGKYVLFVDSDDYLNLECVNKLVNNALKNKSDLVIYNYYLVTNEKNIKITIPHFKPCNLKTNPDLITKINLGPCNKLYHKSLLEKDNRFVTDLKYEDAPFVITSLLTAKKISYENSYLYYYVMKPTGETLNRDSRLLDILKICDIIKSKTKDYEYINTPQLIVKILIPYLKNSRYIKDYHLRNKVIKEIYLYLDNTSKNWTIYLKNMEEDSKKRIILAHKLFLKSVNNFYALIK